MFVKLLFHSCQQDKEKGQSDFQEVFNAPTYYTRVFGASEYQLHEKSQKETRKPKSLPKEDHLQMVYQYLEDELTSVEKHGINTVHDYTHARRVGYVYGTLLNGKRGSAYSKIECIDWIERNAWIDLAMMQERDHQLLDNWAVLFFMGKDRKKKGLEPIVYPKQTHKVLDMLVDPVIRKKAGVSEENTYLFAYTETSDEGAIGYK